MLNFTIVKFIMEGNDIKLGGLKMIHRLVSLKGLQPNVAQQLRLFAEKTASKGGGIILETTLSHLTQEGRPSSPVSQEDILRHIKNQREQDPNKELIRKNIDMFKRKREINTAISSKK